MKRIYSILLIMIFLLPVASFAENADIPSSVKTEISVEQMAEKFGVCFSEPENAQSINYYLVCEDSILEMVFLIDNIEYTARAKQSYSFEDISGIHIKWDMEYIEPIYNIEGLLLYAFTDTDILSAYLWFDETHNMMYSLSCMHDYYSVSDVCITAELVFLNNKETASSASIDTETLHTLILLIASEQSIPCNACSLVSAAVELYNQNNNDSEFKQACIEIFATLSESDFRAFESHFSQVKDSLLSDDIKPSDITSLLSQGGFMDDASTFVNDRTFRIWVNFIYVIDSAIDNFINSAEAE